MAEEPQAQEKGKEKSEKTNSWLPLILVILFVPVITMALTEFVVIPRLRASLGPTGPTEAKSSANAHGKGGHGKSHGGSKDEGGSTTEVVFSDLIANLSGTMGTRYMKVSFHVAGEDSALAETIDASRPRVQDAIITTLSNKTIQELEATGGRNALRVSLISAINQALDEDLVEELYFTEFIVQ